MQHLQMLTGIGEEMALQPMSEDDLRRNSNRNLIPRFFRETVGGPNGSFIEREMVEILIPGDSKSGPIHKVNEGILKRFPLQYKNWKLGIEQSLQGTPLELVVGTGSIIYQLKAMNIHNVEQLAEVSDGNLEQLGTGGRNIRERARQILAAKSNAAVVAEQAKKDQEIATLKAQVAELMEAVGKKPKKAKVEEKEEEDDEDALPKSPPEGAVRVEGSKPNLTKGRRVRRGG